VSFAKYLVLFKNYLQTYIYYRANAFIWALVDSAHFVVIIFVWATVFINQQQIAGLNFSQIINYYLVALIIRELLYTGAGRNKIAEEIYSGQLSSHLLKPYNFLIHAFAEEISWRLVQTFLFIIPYLVILILIKKIFFTTVIFNLSPLIVIIMVLSFIISSFLDYLCALAAFWLVQTTTLFHIKDILYYLLSGLALPLSLFPLLIKQINLALPFYYVFAFPIELVTKQLATGQILARLTMQLVWIIILGLTYKTLWKKGQKTYDAFGN
jgi:ABC-2 type transport system permease protein